MAIVEKTSYLAQVKRMQLLAQVALRQYPIRVKEIHLKRYAANTVYKVIDNKNRAYQLRIHPKKWHTKAAILEEIHWLHHILRTTDLSVPRPIPADDDQFVIQCHHLSVSTDRFCELFEWLPGRKRWRSINKQYAQDLGSIIGMLQKNGQAIAIKHRHYWDVDSLVGTSGARYFNIEKLSDISKNQQAMITHARRAVYNRLMEYEKAHKNKSGLIHGDLQPNNILYHKKSIAVIDFDDCGIGLYIYELATALHAFRQVAEGNENKNYTEMKEALFDGYVKYMSLTKEDVQVIPYLLLALRLVTIGWLEKHKDNPNVRSYYSHAIAEAINSFKKLEKC